MDNIQGNMYVENEYVLKIDRQPRMSILMLVWAGFWTGVLLCGFVLLLS
jgi:hypothetical protein